MVLKQSQAYQQRVENILSSLKRLDYMSRSQIQMLHRLGSASNTNRILRSMDQYLCSFRYGMENVYYLSKHGRDRVGAETVRKKTMQARHYILRNQLCIMMGYPSTWQNEMRIKIADTSIICDAMFAHPDNKDTPCFVEIDCSQTMKQNEQKISRYKRFAEMTDQPFNLLWVTDIQSRKPRLERLCEGLACVVHASEDIRL